MNNAIISFWPPRSPSSEASWSETRFGSTTRWWIDSARWVQFLSVVEIISTRSNRVTWTSVSSMPVSLVLMSGSRWTASSYIRCIFNLEPFVSDCPIWPCAKCAWNVYHHHFRRCAVGFVAVAVSVEIQRRSKVGGRLFWGNLNY